ncbi:MAG: helix-turn-helix domain-containing protein [Octadecabacter sp.]
MKRRNFLQGIAASAGAAAMPLPTFAKAAAMGTTKVIPFHYGWACVYAQMNNGVSAADIARVFRISPSDASGLMDRMFARGVIHAPGLDGRSHPTRAWQPWDKRTPAAPTHAETKHRISDENRSLLSKFDAVMAHVVTHPSYGWAA